MNLTDFTLLSFDCYGTLIDWERGIIDALRPDFDRAGVAMDEQAVLAAFAEAEPRREEEAPTDPYPLILQRVHNDILAAVGQTSRPSSGPEACDDEAERFAHSVGDWPPFPDTVEGLRLLKANHKLAILSNVDRESFARTNEKLSVTFDAVITAEDVGAYKPDPRMFDRLIETARGLGAERDAILHVAQSLYHDIAPAKRAGLRTCWVNRRGDGAGGATRTPDTDAEPDLTVRSLRELAE